VFFVGVLSEFVLTSQINMSRLVGMKLQQPDGFPLTFNLPDAATLTGGRVSNLRNYVARDILKHVGQIPYAGQERRFTVTGLVEVAIIDALSESVSLPKASRVADCGLRMAYAAAILAGGLPQEPTNPIPGADNVSDPAKYPDTFPFDANPQYWFSGSQWEHSDLANPVFWVFAFEENGALCFNVAYGWSDIKRASEEIAKQTFRVLLPSVPWGAPATKMSSLPQPSEEYLQTAVPHVHFLNLTAILTKINHAIEEKLSGKL
jgi:hypothetical protein